jgi:hypothetical protein
MDHLRFKAEQTAASYVAHALDERAQEDFELHLMACPECIDDVEAWRAIDTHLPATANAAAVAAAPSSRLSTWRLAASLAAIGIAGAAGGFYARPFADPPLAKTAVFNLAPLARGAGECMALSFAADTRKILVRAAAVGSERRVVALDARGEELSARDYSARRQDDGSWLMSIAPDALARRTVRLEARAANAPPEPLGCIVLSARPKA